MIAASAAGAAFHAGGAELLERAGRAVHFARDDTYDGRRHRRDAVEFICANVAHAIATEPTLTRASLLFRRLRRVRTSTFRRARATSSNAKRASPSNLIRRWRSRTLGSDRFSSLTGVLAMPAPHTIARWRSIVLTPSRTFGSETLLSSADHAKASAAVLAKDPMLPNAPFVARLGAPTAR